MRCDTRRYVHVIRVKNCLFELRFLRLSQTTIFSWNCVGFIHLADSLHFLVKNCAIRFGYFGKELIKLAIVNSLWIIKFLFKKKKQQMVAVEIYSSNGKFIRRLDISISANFISKLTSFHIEKSNGMKCRVTRTSKPELLKCKRKLCAKFK